MSIVNGLQSSAMAIAAVSGWLCCASALAQGAGAYADKPITIIVASVAGGSAGHPRISPH